MPLFRWRIFQFTNDVMYTQRAIFICETLVINYTIQWANVSTSTLAIIKTHAIKAVNNWPTFVPHGSICLTTAGSIS